MDQVSGRNALKCSGRTNTFLALRSHNWLLSCAVVIVCFHSAPRLHYIPLCLLENNYGAIKSNAVSQTRNFPVSDGHTFPSCLLWLSTLVMVKRYSCQKKTQQMAVVGDASYFYWVLSDTWVLDFHQCWCAIDFFQITWIWKFQWQNSSSSRNEEKLKCP